MKFLRDKAHCKHEGYTKDEVDNKITTLYNTFSKLLDGEVLWEGKETLEEAGITLNQDYANFKRIKVYYGNKYITQKCEEILVSTNEETRKFQMDYFGMLTSQNGTTLVGFDFSYNYANAEITGNKMKLVRTHPEAASEFDYGCIRMSDDGSIVCENGNGIYIHKVVGYKY